MGWWSDLRGRYEKVVEEFGRVAIGTYFVLFFGTWFSFWLAIRSGVAIEGAASTAGTVGGAYVATKLTQPVRIAATIVLAPLVMKLLRLRTAAPASASTPD